MSKICKVCNIEKGAGEFRLDKRTKDGRRTVCKECEGVPRDTVAHHATESLSPAQAFKDIETITTKVTCSPEGPWALR